MATSSHRREGVPAAAAPRFFKIIMDPEADSLRIPDEFSKRYGHNLPNPVFLKIPSGSLLEVGLIESNGKTMLRKGWQEFIERYSIGFGHFLVFEYNGYSVFNVLIFDTTAVEINYPLDANYEAGMDYKKVADHKDPKLEDNITESDDDSVVFLQELLTGNRGKRKAENVKDSDVSIELLDNPLARRHNRKNSRSYDDDIEISDDYPVRKSLRRRQNFAPCFKKDPRSEFSSPNYRSERVPDCRVKLDESSSEKYSDDSGSQCSDRVQMQRSVVKETCIAYQKALAFISAHTPHNPFFISLIQQAYVSNRFLSVPVSFAKRNLPFNRGNLIITVTNGKRWSVRCNVGNRRANLSAGWKDFVQDNGLKVGDACIFEVAKSAKPVWNVVIFRG